MILVRSKPAVGRVDVDRRLSLGPLELASHVQVAQRREGIGQVKRRRNSRLEALSISWLPLSPLLTGLEQRFVDGRHSVVHAVEHTQHDLLAAKDHIIRECGRIGYWKPMTAIGCTASCFACLLLRSLAGVQKGLQLVFTSDV